MPSLGGPEIFGLVILAIIIFGVGKLGDLGGALGRGIREFRTQVRDDEAPTVEKLEDQERPRP